MRVPPLTPVSRSSSAAVMGFVDLSRAIATRFQTVGFFSGLVLRWCFFTSAPEMEPSTPVTLKRAVFPAGQSQGRSLFPVSMTPVLRHWRQ